MALAGFGWDHWENNVLLESMVVLDGNGAVVGR